MSCYDSSYYRNVENGDGAGWSAECLVYLEANGKVRVGLSKVSTDANGITSTCPAIMCKD